jgi:hypothetical protein
MVVSANQTQTSNEQESMSAIQSKQLANQEGIANLGKKSTLEM